MQTYKPKMTFFGFRYIRLDQFPGCLLYTSGKLRQACDNFAEITKTQDAVQIAQADVELHDIIVQGSRNEKLAQMVSNLSQQMEYLKRLVCSDVISKWKLVVSEAKYTTFGAIF